MNNITENTATTPRSDPYPEGVEANSPIGLIWFALRLHGFENLEVFNKGVIVWWREDRLSDTCVKMSGSFLIYDDWTKKSRKRYHVHSMTRCLCDGKDVMPRSDPSSYDPGFTYETMSEALGFIDKCIDVWKQNDMLVI